MKKMVMVKFFLFFFTATCGFTEHDCSSCSYGQLEATPKIIKSARQTIHFLIMMKQFWWWLCISSFCGFNGNACRFSISKCHLVEKRRFDRFGLYQVDKMVINPLWAAEPPSSNSIQFNKLLQLLILQIDPNITIRLQKSNLDSWLFPQMTFIRTENNTVDNLLSVTHLTRCYFQTDICNLWISANFCHISAQRLDVFSSRSDLHSEFTCVVKNNNISAPLRHTVHLDMNCKSL